MTTLIAVSKTTDSLAPLHILTVSVPADSAASVTRLGDRIGDTPESVTAIAADETKLFGPFAMATRWKFVCAAGTATITTAPADLLAVDQNIERMVKLTQSEYDALDPPDSKTLYMIVG